jgi:hypothetical protein
MRNHWDPTARAFAVITGWARFSLDPFVVMLLESWLPAPELMGICAGQDRSIETPHRVAEAFKAILRGD